MIRVISKAPFGIPNQRDPTPGIIKVRKCYQENKRQPALLYIFVAAIFPDLSIKEEKCAIKEIAFWNTAQIGHKSYFNLLFFIGCLKAPTLMTHIRPNFLIELVR
jgi:hypothetical protein